MLNPALLTLSREHHLSLSLGNKCVNVAKSGNTDEITTLCLAISTQFRHDFSAHFETEEATIFAFLKNKSTALKQLCEQLTSEHQQLHQLAETLINNPKSLNEFGLLLKSHTRLEDRELFKNIDLLSTNEKQVILDASAKHPPISKI